METQKKSNQPKEREEIPGAQKKGQWTQKENILFAKCMLEFRTEWMEVRIQPIFFFFFPWKAYPQYEKKIEGRDGNQIRSKQQKVFDQIEAKKGYTKEELLDEKNRELFYRVFQEVLDDYRSAKGKIKKSVRDPEQPVTDVARKELKTIPASQDTQAHAPSLPNQLSLPKLPSPALPDISDSNFNNLAADVQLQGTGRNSKNSRRRGFRLQKKLSQSRKAVDDPRFRVDQLAREILMEQIAKASKLLVLFHQKYSGFENITAMTQRLNMVLKDDGVVLSPAGQADFNGYLRRQFQTFRIWGYSAYLDKLKQLLEDIEGLNREEVSLGKRGRRLSADDYTADPNKQFQLEANNLLYPSDDVFADYYLSMLKDQDTLQRAKEVNGPQKSIFE